MPDRENVINRMETICNICKENTWRTEFSSDTIYPLLRDAIALLKEQEEQKVTMDREKVIGGLAACTGEPNGCAGHTCPYWDFDDSESDWGCRGQLELDALSLLKEQEEKLKFLDALFNYINPNDMEKYMRMYRSLPVPSNGRSVKCNEP